MLRSVLALSGCFVVLLMMSVPAAGQAMGEAAAAASASSTGAAGARSVGKSIGGMFGKVNDTLKSTDHSAASSTTSTKSSPRKAGKTSSPPQKSAPPAEAAPAPSYEDAMRIQKGIGYEELLRRFGPPAMQIAAENDAQTMSYIGKSGAVQLELRDGKVISITVMKSGA